MPPQALAAVATLLSFAPHGNRIELRLDRGSAEMVWLTPSTFHFRRVLDGPLRPADETAREPVRRYRRTTPRARCTFARACSMSRSASRAFCCACAEADGTPLLLDLTPPRSEAGGVVWERQTLPGRDYFGLGPRTDPTFDLRGKSLAGRRAAS